jgi:Protein of unknown function (DUF4011)
LLYFKDRRSGTLDLAAADPDALAHFIETGSIRLTRLFRDVDVRTDAIRRIQVIYRKARELLEERGIRAGYLATGMARWDELSLQPAAPVLLRGLTITPTRARHDDFELTLDDEPDVNPVLLHKLSSVYGAATDKLADQRGERLYAMLTAAAEAAEVPGFAIVYRNVIGTFTYAKLPMVRDLQNAAELLTDSCRRRISSGRLPTAKTTSRTRKTRTSSRSGPGSSPFSTRCGHCCRPGRWPGITGAGTSAWSPSPTPISTAAH